MFDFLGRTISGSPWGSKKSPGFNYLCVGIFVRETFGYALLDTLLVASAIDFCFFPQTLLADKCFRAQEEVR